MTLHIDGMTIWSHCRWKGKEPDCGLQGSEEDACSEMGDGMHPLISASRGSGSTQCLVGGFLGWFKKPAPQTYCCFQDSSAERWEQCFWNNDALDDGHCRASCPSPYIKVGLDDKSDECKSGRRAYCCRALVTTLPHDEEGAEKYRRELMKSWVEAPVCPADGNPLESIESRSIKTTPTEPEDPTTLDKAKKRDVRLSDVAFVEQAASTMLSDAMVHIDEEWNDLIANRWTFMTTDKIREIYWMSDGVKKLVKENVWEASDSVLCQMNQWDDFISQGGSSRLISCPAEPIRDFMPPEF